MPIMSTPRKPLRLAIFVAFVLLVSFYTFSDRLELDAPLAVYVNHPYAYVRSSFDWARRRQKYPVSSYEKLPKEPPRPLPRIQYDFKKDEGVQESRREEVKKTFQKCWRSYRKHAWGFDELTPVSLRGADTFGGWGATLVDSLDALWVMGLHLEFREAVHHVVGIDWDAHPGHDVCSLFETNIRYLGGLLAAYDLSGEAVLLRKAAELGNMLFSAFDTPNRMPANSFHFERAKESLLLPSTREISANVGSLSLEFTRLSQLTGDPKFFDAITRVKAQLQRSQGGTKLPGMWPTFVDVQNGFLTPDNSFTLGSMADSLYEYLPKMYALLGGLDGSYRDMYVGAMDTAKAFLLFRPMVPPDQDSDMLFSGTVLSNGKDIIDLMPQGQHLTCFVGGMFALGGKLFGIGEDLEIGARLARGCAWAYKAMPTGVMPEEFTLIPCKEANMAKCEWDEERWAKEGRMSLPKGFSGIHVKGYMLRPEAIESLFYLYRITGDPVWQDMAWDMFQSIKKVTETKYAHSAIQDVTSPPESAKKTDKMESFWLAETLKYFYLIFSEPDLLSLDDFVLNTEAHPLRIPKPS